MVELAEGWRYVTGSVPIRSILLLLALVSLVGMPYTVLMPVFAAQVLRGGPHTLGWLMSSVGTGALAGAIALAGRRSVVGLGRVIPISAGLDATRDPKSVPVAVMGGMVRLFFALG